MSNGQETSNSASSARKKRLSAKERKALKKKQKLSHHNSIVSTTNDPLSNSSANSRNSEESLEIDYMKSYEPVPIPTEPSKDVLIQKKKKNVADREADHEGGTDCRTLGKWFPDAVLIRCQVSYTNTGQLIRNGQIINPTSTENNHISNIMKPKASIVLFYQYTPKGKKWTQEMVKLLMTFLTAVGKKRNIGGRIRVAQEGVNCTISAVDMIESSALSDATSSVVTRTAKEILRHVAQDLRNFDPVFNKTDFKFIDDLSPDRHFKELKIIPVQELVFYGLKEEDASCSEGGVHLDAKDYHEMLKKNNAVVIDVRNHYEAIIGRFDGQTLRKTNDAQDKDPDNQRENSTGAQYIDPMMRKSTDFTQWLAKEETKKSLENKTVLMFCTGGIRCERASAYLKKEMGDKVDGVFQLQGGIEKYLQEFPDGGFWRGKNFVFDKREAISADNKDGDGGVVKKKRKQHSNTQEDDLPANCCVCSKKWDRYVGKKKCYTCGVPVLMCDKCMEMKPDKIKGKELSVRCPLCVKENITVPANAVEFTQNGVKSKGVDMTVVEGGGKVADSVLKWGGGHASNKKLKRRMKRTTCQFGKECHRPDCLFFHPDRMSEQNLNLNE